jgi:plasmid replication initiation protein
MKVQLAKINENDLHVNMSNQLIKMAQGLTLPEKRVISLCMAKLDSVRLDNTGRYKFRISAKEFGEQFGITDEAAYMQLKEVGDKLLHRIAQEIRQTPKGRNVKKWQWVSFAEYQDGEGWMKLIFNHEMTPHLFMLRKEFTSYKLKQASALRSVYSWRLFELLMQFKSTGLLRMDIEEFCHAMDAPATAQKNFGELRRRIIEPAVKELITKNNLLLAWEQKKAGRKVIGLEFRFKENPQQSLI